MSSTDQSEHRPALRRLRRRWDAGQPGFGLWASLPTVLTAELAASAGYDYVCVDLQHGGADETTMVAMFAAIEAAGATPLARVAFNEPWMIMRVLDLGASGVVVPLVNSREEAIRAVRACRFPPHGMRSYGPLRAAMTSGSTDPDVLGDVLCIVMVETSEGLENVEEIAATPGLDAIYVGPADTALSLGRKPGQGGDALEQAIARVNAACAQAGIAPGIHCGSGREARARAEAGFRLVTVAVDTNLFSDRITRELADAHAA
jgi:4-hydroxy-2-oxoheptanedioate aldolase